MGADGEAERQTPGAAAREIATDRLVLRPQAAADGPALASMAADKAVASNLCAAIAPDGRNTFVIAGRDDPNAILGCAGYGVARDMPGSTEIGVWLGVPWWGRGYATEALQALIDRAFGEDRLKALWCSSRVTNTRARRVIEKCGFQFRGTGMVRSPTAFGAFPVERFVLDRRNWESLKAWGARRSGTGKNDGTGETQRESAA